ncbi:CPBP family intramembrane metalloprotease [Halorussus limi]|uniref:CPBP family intramembrane metalloprotease n=1 Tax=Halorussus limi TaxID=2938695 RepID=A0A8U0HWC4_9EURY|nr:CPBP family intramembrane glutamic endopeptidase [Halorussus limi]UPV75129.1 CPBP family intramembrane metalloprotease [Halorussus limi]
MPSRTLTFRGGARTAIGFVVAFALVLTGAMPVKRAVSDASGPVTLAFRVSVFVVLAGIALVALRREDVEIADLGLSSRHLPPAVVAFGGVWVALNLLGVGAAAVTGNPWGLGLLRETTPVLVAGLPAPRVTTLLFFFLAVGMVEEFAMRGYFQTKVVALLGDDTRTRVALGILTASLVFGLGHVPSALVAGASVRGTLSAVALSAASGVAFGVLYETTRNLYFVGFLHGLGDTWPLVVDWMDWSGSALGAFLFGIAVVYFGAALVYRYWALDTDLTPAIRRRESSRSAATGSAVPRETPKSESE